MNMQDGEFNQQEEFGARPPETMPLPQDIDATEEITAVAEQITYSEHPTVSGESSKAATPPKAAKQQGGQGSSNMAMRFMSATVAVSAVVTVGAVVSDGSFLPELAKAAKAAYVELAVPAVAPQEGIDASAIVKAWEVATVQGMTTNAVPTPEPIPTPAPIPVPPPVASELPPVAPELPPVVQELPPAPKPKEPVHVHQYSGKVTTAATCGVNGAMTFTCPCGKSYTEVIPATGQHRMTEAITAPTCTAAGGTLHTCADCGYQIQDTPVAALGHSYDGGVTTTTATCAASGVTTFTCHCGEYYTEPIPATGQHSYSGWTVADAASHNHQCTVCGAVETAAHHITDTVTAPTCTVAGGTLHRCADCGYQVQDTPVAALGHSYDGGVITTPATCGAAGVTTVTCTRCPEAYTTAIPATGNHGYGQWSLVDDLTHKRTCTGCGLEESAPHNWVGNSCTDCNENLVTLTGVAGGYVVWANSQSSLTGTWTFTHHLTDLTKITATVNRMSGNDSRNGTATVNADGTISFSVEPSIAGFNLTIKILYNGTEITSQRVTGPGGFGSDGDHMNVN
ncbi:MAG: hypothetical protein RR022_03155 [Angelakisella sp.]